MNIKRIAGISLLLLGSFVVSAQLNMKNKDGGILIADGKKNVFFYQIQPKSVDGKFKRSNYIHPLYGMDGKIITEDFPADHLHHRGVFWAWHQVWIGDKRIGDPWEIKDFEQDVVEVEFIKQSNGSVQLNTEVEWKSNLWIKAGEKVPYIREYANIIVHPTNGNYRKIDFVIKLKALEDGLSIGGSEDMKGYGGFSVRMALPEDVKFSGKEGAITPEVTAVKSDGFIDIAGKIGVNSTKGGIVIVDHPENPGYPQSWILRNKNSMQNAVYPGNELVPVLTSQPLVLKYSLLIYSGKLSTKKIAEICSF